MNAAPDNWFVTRPLGRGVHLIAEPGHVCSWLVTGRERALLIDSGLGVASIATVVAELTDLPVTLVNTHYHFDHVGGNHEFADIAIHALGVECLRRPLRDEYLSAYMRLTTDRLRVSSRYEDLHERLFEMDAPEELTMRALPSGFDPAAWSIRPSRASTVLEDGDVIDLGGRALTVIHTPGHSPDGISLLDEKSGLLFPGDVVQGRGGWIYAHFEDSDAAQLAASVERLRALEDELDTIFFCHWPWPTVESDLLSSIADDVRRAVEGELPEVTVCDVLGNSVRQARGAACTLSLPTDVLAPSLTVT
jgi:glyoxylase-like metal-dependent hydrolase (beta-lactamase superfamily II)